MRKKSHVSLAGYITGQETEIRHRAVFKMGSIVPDLVPSFITKKHEINQTFDILEKKMNRVVDTYDSSKGLTLGRTKDLGVITHYIADYFTFPHNKEYEGSLKDHVIYEKELKYELKSFISSVDVDMPMEHSENLGSIANICDFIRKAHEAYTAHVQNAQSDCRHIVQICGEVVSALISLMQGEGEAEAALVL